MVAGFKLPRRRDPKIRIRSSTIHQPGARSSRCGAADRAVHRAAPTTPPGPPVRHLDDWQWGIRLGVGSVSAVTGNGTTDQAHVKLGQGYAITVDLVRALRCEIEVFRSATRIVCENLSVTE